MTIIDRSPSIGRRKKRWPYTNQPRGTNQRPSRHPKNSAKSRSLRDASAPKEAESINWVLDNLNTFSAYWSPRTTELDLVTKQLRFDLHFSHPKKWRTCFVSTIDTVNNWFEGRFDLFARIALEPVNQRHATTLSLARNPLFSDPINGGAISRESLRARWKAYRAKPSRSRSHEDAISVEVYGASVIQRPLGAFRGTRGLFRGKAQGKTLGPALIRVVSVTDLCGREREIARW